MERIIMHYDMDAFYASIEINRNPKLKNKPLVVGENIVTTASYEARKYGIHSAMKVSDAKLLCPKLIAIPVDKKEYIRISNEIHNLILKITNKVEFIATDEGYIDLTGIVKPENKIQFALKFKERIKELTNLTCSVGIGFNKLSAKIASDINKPFGIYIFENEKEFLKYIVGGADTAKGGRDILNALNDKLLDDLAMFLFKNRNDLSCLRGNKIYVNVGEKELNFRFQTE